MPSAVLLIVSWSTPADDVGLVMLLNCLRFVCCGWCLYLFGDNALINLLQWKLFFCLIFPQKIGAF